MAGIDTYTKLLLHCNGTDESTIFTDDSDSSHTVTANGDAQLDTAQKKFGTASGLFDGNGDYLSIPDHEDWNFGTGDWTIDFWVRINSRPATKVWFIGNDANLFRIRQEYVVDTWKWNVEGFGSSLMVGSSTINTWYHVAVVVNNLTRKLYIDGIEIGSGSATTADMNAWFVGHTANEVLIGWMDEIRVSKGIARWTSNFNPYEEAYSADAISKFNGINWEDIKKINGIDRANIKKLNGISI